MWFVHGFSDYSRCLVSSWPAFCLVKHIGLWKQSAGTMQDGHLKEGNDMEKIWAGVVLFVALSVWAPVNAMAYSYSTIVKPVGFNPTVANQNPDAVDTGDADGYGEASNTQGKWQRLGTEIGVDDGVTWSVNGSTYGTDVALVIGEEVTFKFLFWQGNNGIHKYDQLLAVVDFDQDKKFELNALETLINIDIKTLKPRYETPNDLSDARYIEYYVTLTVPKTIQADTSTWLRARAHCNHADLAAYGFYTQGETEDYLLNFVAAPVPEPATMLLFGTGIAGLAGIARRKRD